MVIMDVYLLRHGKAEERSANISSDAKRPLTASGISEMCEISRGISSLGICPHLIISSPLARAKETAQIVFDQIKKQHNFTPRRATWRELTPESDVISTHTRLSSVATPDVSIMLVGHQPHLSLLASSIVVSGSSLHARANMHHDQSLRHVDSGNCDSLAMTLKKGGLVIMRCMIYDGMICGSLRSLMTPKQLRLCGSHTA